MFIPQRVFWGPLCLSFFLSYYYYDDSKKDFLHTDLNWTFSQIFFNFLELVFEQATKHKIKWK